MESVIKSIFLIGSISSSIGILLFIYGDYQAKKNKNYPNIKNKKCEKYAILIPARNESKVIERLLISINNQTKPINMEDVYVIVEDKKDKTVNISKKYNCSVIIRKNLELNTKGYALDEAIKEIIKKKKKYDIYFIFDADNILDKNYLSEMSKTIDKGYDIGIGYRNCKNGNDNVIAAASSLTFSMINTISNEKKQKRTNNLVISGTGFYIRGEYIDKWKSYPFNSLTEDYELTLYATLNNLTTSYNKKAIFYDEQPIKYKQTITQRIRWIRGYFDSRKKYIPLIRNSLSKKDMNYGSKVSEIIGVKPLIYLIIGIVLIIISLLIPTSFKSLLITISSIITLILIIYLMMLLITGLMLYKEKNNLSLNYKSKIKVLFFNPLYLVTYIPCAIKALIKKEIVWEKIEHKG